MEPPFYELVDAWGFLQPHLELFGDGPVPAIAADKILARSANSLYAYHARCAVSGEEEPLTYGVLMWSARLWHSTSPKFQEENTNLRRAIRAPPKFMLDKLDYYDISNPRLSKDGLIGPLNASAWIGRPATPPPIPSGSRFEIDMLDTALETTSPPSSLLENAIELSDSDTGEVIRKHKPPRARPARGTAKPKSRQAKVLTTKNTNVQGKEKDMEMLVDDKDESDPSRVYNDHAQSSGGFEKPKFSCLACHLRGEVCQTAPLAARGWEVPLLAPCNACRRRKIGCTFSKTPAIRSIEQDGAYEFGRAGKAGLQQSKDSARMNYQQHVLLLAGANHGLSMLQLNCNFIRNELESRLAELGPVELYKDYIGRPPTPAESRMTSENLIANLMCEDLYNMPLDNAEIAEGLTCSSTFRSFSILSDDGDELMSAKAKGKRKRKNPQETPKRHEVDVDLGEGTSAVVKIGAYTPLTTPSGSQPDKIMPGVKGVVPAKRRRLGSAQ